MTIEATDATSTASDGGTTEASAPDSSSELNTASPSEPAEGRTAEAAPSDEGDVKVDLDSVPKDLRPHVEKFVKKYEKDFKGTYTRKFQDLSAKEKLWEQERSKFTAEREQWKQVASEVLKDPKKLDAYREIYGIPAPQTEEAEDAIPENVKTVGDLLAWNKQQIAKERDRLRQELRMEAANIVKSTQEVQTWDGALKEASKDKHFAKYKDVIVEMAKKNLDTQAKYQAGMMTAAEVLKVNHDQLRAMLREDMEEVKAATLAEQRKKAGATTSMPTKTMPTVQKGAASKDEVIARIRSRLGPPEVTQ